MKINKSAIDAATKEFEKIDNGGYSSGEIVSRILAVALKQSIPKKCDVELYNVFHKEFARVHGPGRLTNAKVKLAILAGTNAVLSHLRGEGKAEASTEPACKESLQVENHEENEKVESLAAVVYRELQQSVATMPVVIWDGYSKDPNHDLSRACRWIARAAILAMKGQLWGVWIIEQNQWRANASHNSDTPFITTDKNAALQVAYEWNSSGGYHKAEARPYTTPQKGSAEEIAMANAIYEKLQKTFRDSPLTSHMIKELIVEAIRETK